MNSNSDTPITFIIDVGANDGAFTIEAATANPNCMVLAIEAIPELCEEIERNQIHRNLKNIKIINRAISSSSVARAFYVSKNGDMGTSSLFQFNKENINNDCYWSRRRDLQHEEKIMVETATLEDIFNEEKIQEVGFLKIDAQGADLEVFLSLGRHLTKIKSGVLESSSTKKKSLYGPKMPDLRETLNTLVEHSFDIHGIHPNDPSGNEYNIQFNAPTVDFDSNASALSLCAIKAYSGKLFWHLPSDKLTDYTTEIHNLKTKLHDARTILHSLHGQVHESNSCIISLKSELDGVAATLSEF